MWAAGKRSLEWNSNDWKWDGDLFIARPMNPLQTSSISRQFFPIEAGFPAVGNSSNSSSSCSDDVDLGFGKGKDLEKKRRVGVIEGENLKGEVEGCLNLKLGGKAYSVCEREVGNCDGNSGKKVKVGGGSNSRSVCQVEDCGVDLSNAKDYHRRHKVCEMHSKASKALVGNAMQRFCQQCSRFHILQEFDEGKRSCRRRLAGHNKRRRKTNPEPAGNGSSKNDDQTSSYLLISLLRMLSNMHSNGSDRPADQELLPQLLRSLAGQTIEHGGRNISGILEGPQDFSKIGASKQVVHVHDAKGSNICTTSLRNQNTANNYPPYSEVQDSNAGHVKMNNFDLNDVYIDSDDGTEDAVRSPALVNGNSSIEFPSWVRQDSHQSSPPQTSGNSDSASGQSPSSSSGDAQSCTDRIIFKLFGKEPSGFPGILRAQILDWLSHSPTDIESFIRPGCIILTLYLNQAEAAWEDLCCDLSSSLTRLLAVSDDPFWRTGWIYIRVRHQVAFVYNGQVIVDASLPSRSNIHSKIISVKPIAISTSERAQFLIKGTNLTRQSTRLLCAIEGNYMIQENSHELMDGGDGYNALDEVQCVNYSCAMPITSGRGFFEIEDHSFSSSSYFPFIVAEEDVCSEIRMLEGALDFNESDGDLGETEKLEAKNQALDFVHEIGWLLHRSQLKCRVGDLDPHSNPFPLRRFKWLLEFSVDHEWCAVVKKLLTILFSGLVGMGEHSSLSKALLEIGLLHRAVRRNSRCLVDFLLSYIPEQLNPEDEALVSGSQSRLLFRPDVSGPAGLTPLHIAAGKDGSEDVLDALTNDPGMVGIEAWKNARDSAGSTPEDYARLRGHYSYMHLMQRKLKKRPSAGHVVLDISLTLSDSIVHEKQNELLTTSFEIGQRTMQSAGNQCQLCSQKLAYGTGRRSFLYRPVMLSMVAIAAVCVCAALLFKSCPEVVYVFRPFRWEQLEYGAS